MARRAAIAKGEVPSLDALRDRAYTVYGERDALIREMRALRFMENVPDVPAEIEPDVVRSPIAYQIIERMVGTLTVEPPLISVPPRAKGAAAEAAASRLEVATAAIIQELARQQDSDVFERFIESLLADGWGAMRIMYAPSRWAGFPKQGKDEPDADYNRRVDEWTHNAMIPITWTWLDPLTVYPFWTEAGLSHVLEIDRRDPLTLAYNRYNVLNAQRTEEEIADLSRYHSERGEVEFAQLWTRDALVYWVDGEVVHYQRHAYGRPPYIIARGVETSIPDPAKAGLSILYPLRHLLPYLDRLLSQRASAVRLWCWPTPLLRLSQFSGQEPREIEIAPGKLVTLFPGEELSFLAWNGNADELDRITAVVMNMIERAGLSGVMYGDAASGDSGYLINQLIAAARMKFKPLVNHAERAMEQLIQTLWDIVEYQIQRPLYVYARGKDAGWVKLDPNDMQGYRQVLVNLQPLLPTDTYARTSRVLAEVQGGLRSIASAMEEIGIEQPDQMMDDIRLDRWLQRPEVEEVLVKEILERYGVLRDMAERNKALSGEEMMKVLPTLPPALQQAILGQSLTAPNPAPGIMAAPGVPAIPTEPQPTPIQLGVRPVGIGTGRAPGVKRRGMEAPNP
jgi:hypothetical protein